MKKVICVCAFMFIPLLAIWTTSARSATLYSETVFGRVYESDGSKPTSITFRAYITSRPGEVLTQNSSGCGYGNSTYGAGVFYVKTGNFSSPCHEGDVLRVDVTSVSGGTGYTTKTLLLSADSWMPNLTLAKVPVLYSETVFGRVYEWNGSKPTSITFRAYITSRPGEVLTQNSSGCGYGNSTYGAGVFYVKTGNFPSPCHEGDVLRVDVTSVSGGTGYTTKTLLLSADSWMPNLWLIGGDTDVDFFIGDNPSTYKLFQNYPNPFNPSTTISYSLPNVSHVELNVYNLRGQAVKSLVSEKQPAGSYSVIWNGTSDYDEQVPSGVYYYRIKADDFCEMRKAIYVR